MVTFFSPTEEARIVTAIRAAELASSGEIRVHVEVGATQPVLDLSARIFRELHMHETADRNGILILLAVDRREFAIVGDEGINAVVPDGYWDAERDILQAAFRRGDFTGGLETVVLQVGEKLKQYFPYQTDDVNELPDEISYGNNPQRP